METTAQRVARLLTALEDLASQESLLLSAGDFHGVLQTQARVAPLVECLAGLHAAAGDADRVRVAAVVAQRRCSEDRLARELARGREELRQLRTNQRRIAQVRPAYGSAATGGQQLRALG